MEEKQSNSFEIPIWAKDVCTEFLEYSLLEKILAIATLLALFTAIWWLLRLPFRLAEKKREPATKEEIEALLSAYTSTLKAQNEDNDAIESAEKAARAIAQRDDPRAQDAIKLVLQGDEDNGFDALEGLAAQNDSQARQQSAETDDTIAKTVEFWIEIGNLAYLNHTHRALHAYEKAIALDDKHKHAWNQIGKLRDRIGELEKAQAAYRRVLDLSENNPAFKAAALGNMGVAEQMQGDLDTAMEYYTQAHALDKGLGNKKGMAANLGNMGNVAMKRGDLDTAKEYYTKAHTLFKESDHKEGLAVNLNNMGLVAMKRGDLAAAMDYYNKANTLNKQLDRKEGLAEYFCNMASVAKQRHNIPEACQLWTQARDLYVEIGARRELESVQGLLDEAGCEGR